MRDLPVVVLLFAVVLGFQITGGAYDAEFGSHPDEAAHYVTGLMVRDYVASGLPGNPMAFAETYYEHYPKVALGNWPPGFYAIQAAWTLAFSDGRASLLVLMAILTCATALVVFSGLRWELGWYAAVFGALLSPHSVSSSSTPPWSWRRSRWRCSAPWRCWPSANGWIISGRATVFFLVCWRRWRS
ncbi:MAG: hypothetical protein H0W08_24900 [Acidobacteria bacterium]|nr:hypothetical protein [Acidobacteriota bacterium]